VENAGGGQAVFVDGVLSDELELEPLSAPLPVEPAEEEPDEASPFEVDFSEDDEPDDEPVAAEERPCRSARVSVT
jgi:hypothetical protein